MEPKGISTSNKVLFILLVMAALILPFNWNLSAFMLGFLVILYYVGEGVRYGTISKKIRRTTFIGILFCFLGGGAAIFLAMSIAAWNTLGPSIESTYVFIISIYCFLTAVFLYVVRYEENTGSQDHS